MAGKNLLVNGKNKITARTNALSKIQTDMANRTTATNVNSTPNLPTPTVNSTNLGLRKAAQPVQTPIVQNNAMNNLNTNIVQPVQATKNVSNIGAGNIVQEPTQSRFIGLQQQPKAKSVADITKSALYIPTAGGTAGKANKKEENKFRTNEQALLDFQADVLKKKGKMKDADIKRLYPEFADQLDVMKELQTELRPIVKNGQGVDGEQLAQYYPELIQPKNLQDVEAIRKQSEKDNQKLQSNIQKVEKVVTDNFDVLSPDGQKYVQDYLTLAGVVDSLKKNYRIVGGANDDEILQYAIKNNPQLKGVADELQNLTLSELDKATIDGNSQSIITSLISGLQKMTRQANTAVQNFAAEQNYIDQQTGNTGQNVFNTTLNVASNILGTADQATTAGARFFGNQNVNYNVGDKVAQEAVEKQEVSDLLAMGGGYWKTIWGIATAPFEYGKLNPVTKPVVEEGIEPLFEGISNLEKTITNPVWDKLGFNEQDKENADALVLAEMFREFKTVKKDVKVRADAAKDVVSDAFKKTVKSNKRSEMKNEFQKAGVYDEAGHIKPEAKMQAAKIIAREFGKDFTENFKNNAKQWGDVVDFYRKKEGVKSYKEQISNIKEGVKDVTNTVKETGKNVGKKVAEGIDKGFDKMDESIETRIDKIRNKVTKEKTTEIKAEETAPIKDTAGWSQPKQGVVGKVVGGVANGIAKGYNATIGKAVDYAAEKGAEAITSTATPQEKLFKALNPSVNVLSRKKGNYEKIQKNAERANELIIEYGDTPTNSADYYNSIVNTKKKIWNNGIQQGLDTYKYTTIDSADLVNPVKEVMKEFTDDPLESLKGDVKLLMKELEALENKKIISLEAMETKKRQINAILEYGLPPDASQIYERGMRELNRQIGIQEDRMISELPGEFSKFKRDYGALTAIEEDAQKLMIKDAKKKLGGNLIQNWSRIEGLMKMGKSLKPGSDANFIEGAAQIILGEALGKVKDTNFLIESGFGALRKQYGPAKGKPEGVKIKKKPPTPKLEDKRTDVEKGKLLEIDKRTKSNREEGYKTKNAVTSEKSAVTEKKSEPKAEVKEPEIKEEKKEEQPKQEIKNKVTAENPVKKSEPKKKTNVEKFREETAKYYPDYQSIENGARDMAESILRDAGVDAEIVDLVFTGSKARGLEHDTSDFDILIELKGNDLREDTLFDILNDKELNDEYDFNPILADKTGTLEDVVLDQEKYMNNKRIIKEIADEYGIKWDKELADDAGNMHGELIKNFLDRTEGPIEFSTHGDGEVAGALDTKLYKQNPQNMSNTFYIGGVKRDMEFLKKIKRPETENSKAYAKLFEVKEEPKNVVTQKATVTTKKPAAKKTTTAKEQLQAIVNKYKDIQMDDFSDENSEGGGVNSQKFKNFAKELKKAYQAVAEENGMELTDYNVGYYDVSAFFKNPDDLYYYVRLDDVRDPEWRKGVLYRTARDSKDYHGGSNRYTDLENLGDAIKGNNVSTNSQETNIKNFMNRPSSEESTENKSGGNAFGLKEQKGSSRINNFTNVIKRIVDKYEGDIEDNSILIEKEPYLPLEITYNPEKKELIVRHINRGYDDPAIKFQIGSDGKLHAIAVKQMRAEQMLRNFDWSGDIKDSNELLHMRAVNLEDQFLDENTIDEDTGEMKERKSEGESELPTISLDDIKSANSIDSLLFNFKKEEYQYVASNGEKGLPVTNYVGKVGDKDIWIRKEKGDNSYYLGIGTNLKKDDNSVFGYGWGKVDTGKGARTLQDFQDRISEYAGGKKTTTEITGEKTAATSKTVENKPKNLVTNRPVDNSSITGRFRNLTLDDYKKMQKYEGFEDYYLNESIDTIKKALSIQDTLEAMRFTREAKEGAYEWNNSDFNIEDYQIDILNKDVKKAIDNYIELYELSERVENGKYTKEDEKDYAHFIDDYDEKTKKPDWNDEYIIEETKDRIQDIFGGDVYNPFIEDFYREFGRQIKQNNHKDLEKDIRELKELVDKYGKWWKQGKTVDNGKNTNIIGKNNSLTTKNPTNDRNNETDIGKKDEGQTELSNSMTTAKANDGGRTRPVDQGAGTSGEKSVSASSNDISEHRAGLENGASSEGVRKSIRTKGDDVITEKTVTQARDINRDCVDILEKHEFSSNPADYTKEEIETLKQYEGRGGINDKSDTETQGALNQYYTKDNIIKAMWRLLDGYSNTDILEPSMGVGRFFMYAPEGSNLAGFEYDKIPGTIAKILYPNADIKIGDFQDNFMLGNLSMGDNYRGKKYDIVIGNPPYEERQGRQKALGEEPKISRFDDYFIKRGVDMLKPGGHLAFVTSSQFLRGADNYAKQKISENAELIDAYRIPVGAFDRTGVETDIIVLRKKEGGGDASLLSASKWFDEHPEKILGEERDDVMGRFGPKKAVVGDLGAIDEIAKTRTGTDGQPATLKSEFTPMEKVKETKADKPVTTKTIEAKEEKKTAPVKKYSDKDWVDWTEVQENDDGTTETVTWGKSLNGVIFKGKGGPTGRMTVGKGGVGKYQKLLNANGKIGDPTITLESDREGLNYIAGELEPNILYASGQIPKKLEQLEKDYEGGFIDEKQYNKQRDLLEQAMPEEIEYQNIYFSPYLDWIMDFPTNEIKSVWRGGKMVDGKATVRDLFEKYVNEKMDSYAPVVYEKKTKTGTETATAKAGLVMIDIVGNKGKGFPTEAKEKVMTLLPKEFNSFLKGTQLDTDTKARLQTEYNKKYNSYANFDYSDLGYTVDDIAPTFKGDTFNISDVQARGISRILTTESMIIAHGVGQGKTIEGIIGAVASMQQGKARKALVVVPAGTKADRMQTTAQLFPNQEMVDLGSLAKGTGIRKKLVDMYGPDPRDWIQDGQLVFLEHSAIGRQISFKNDTLAELEQNLTDVMDSHFEVEKNIDEAKKNLERKDKEIERLREKGASAADLEKKQKAREELIGEIQKMGRTTENTLQDILNTYADKGLPEDGIGKALELIDEDYDAFMNDMGEYLDHEINVGQAKINKADALKVAQDIFNNERAIYMEDLGIDHLTVDEAHNFRNLFNKAIQDDDGGGSYHAGMQTKEGSKQAKNLYAMSQYVMSKNGGGNVILLTATPFINDPSEMYNMLSYVGKNGMMEMGVTSMDDFYDNFVGLENKLSPTASTSGVAYKNVMIGFNNTETLVKNLLDRYIDYEGESGKVVKPRLVTNITRLKMSDTQAQIQKKLEEQIDKNEFDDTWEGATVKERKLNDKGEAKGAVLEGMTQANLNLISPYLTKYLKDKLGKLTWQDLIESSPKLKMVVKATKLLRDMGIMRGVFVYMDKGKELHEKLKKAIEESIPGIRVGIINGDKKYADLSAAEAAKLGIEPEGAKARQTAKKFSNGELDVLIGGENTKEGLNLQGNGYLLLEVSQPRNANDRIQLNGRMWRNGNKSNEVLDTLLLMENSSDIYRFELMSRKESRWNILEQLSAYKKGEKIEDVKVEGQLDMNEEKLALFTDPEKKAKVSIVMEKAALEEQKAQTKGQIATIEKLINMMSSWKNDYGRYRKLGDGVTRMDKLKDEDGKAITTDILADNALEPLEQQVDYAWNEAMKKMQEYNERRTEKWTKAEMEKNIKNNSPYSYEAVEWRNLKDKMQQARSERNLVIRQTESLGIDTIEGLSDFILELEQQLRGIESKLTDVESTFNDKVAMFKAQAEANKANEMDMDTMLEDLKEDFKHQVTLSSKDELKNWLEVTKNLPKREQARNKAAVTGGKNKYSWNAKDYVGQKATFEKPKNLITSKYEGYSESNPKPEIKYIGYTPKEIIKTKDGNTLTRIGYQMQFQKMNNTLKAIKKKVVDTEEQKSYWRRDDVDEILGQNDYYNGLKTRLSNMILKFAQRYDNEIIKAYKSDNPGKTPTGPEDFYNYINNYNAVPVNMNLGTESKEGLQYSETKVEDEYVKAGAEYLFNKYNTKNNVIATDKNRVTSGKTMASRAYSPTIVMRLDDNGNPLRTAKNKVTSQKPQPVQNKPMEFSPELVSKIDKLAEEMGLEGNTIKKMKVLNKEVDKGKGYQTETEKEIYNLKKQIIIEYVKSKGRTIKDKGQKKTIVDIKQGKTRVHWHVVGKLYRDLKREGIIK